MTGLSEELDWQRKRLKAAVFGLIRPLFVADLDRNEDFECEWCNEPVLRRYMFCSKRCEKEFVKWSVNP